MNFGNPMYRLLVLYAPIGRTRRLMENTRRPLAPNQTEQYRTTVREGMSCGYGKAPQGKTPHGTRTQPGDNPAATWPATI